MKLTYIFGDRKKWYRKIWYIKKWYIEKIVYNKNGTALWKIRAGMERRNLCHNVI